MARLTTDSFNKDCERDLAGRKIWTGEVFHLHFVAQGFFNSWSNKEFVKDNHTFCNAYKNMRLSSSSDYRWLVKAQLYIPHEPSFLMNSIHATIKSNKHLLPIQPSDCIHKEPTTGLSYCCCFQWPSISDSVFNYAPYTKQSMCICLVQIHRINKTEVNT